MERLRAGLPKMRELIPERNRDGARPVTHRVIELVSAALEEKNKGIDRLKDQDPGNVEAHRQMLGKWEMDLRRRDLERRNREQELELLKDRAEEWKRIAPQVLACQKLLRVVHGLDTGRALSTAQINRLTGMVYPAYNRCDLQYIDGGFIRSPDFLNHPELARDTRVQSWRAGSRMVHFDPPENRKRPFEMLEDGSASDQPGASSLILPRMLPAEPGPLLSSEAVSLAPTPVADGAVQGKLLRFTYASTPSEDPNTLLTTLPLDGCEHAFAARVATAIHLVVQLGASAARKQRRALEVEYTYRGIPPVIEAYKSLPGPGGLSRQYENVRGQELYKDYVVRA